MGMEGGEEGAAEDRRICFIIGPIGDRNAEVGSEGRTRYEQAVQVLEHIIQPACSEVGLTPLRADRMARPGEIPEQVCRMLRDSEVVIADLTGANPNVMYELGLRHSKQLLTIQIGEGLQLPFDVHAIKTIPFRRSEGGLIEARDELIEALREGLAGNYDPVTATRVWFEIPSETTEVEPAFQQAQEEEPGLLERIAWMEEALPEANATMIELSAISSDLSTRMNEVVEEVAASDSRGGGAAGRLAVAARFAGDLDASAEKVEELAERYEAQMRAIDPGVTTILSRLEEDPSQAIDDAVDFLQAIANLGPIVSQFVDSSTRAADQMDSFGRLAIPLRRPSARYSKAVRRIVGAFVVADNWATRASRLLAPDGESATP